MAPEAQLIVYYHLTGTNEVVADTITLDVDLKFPNKPHVTFDRNTTKPGEELSVILESPDSHSDSCVCVTISDNSMYLLAPHHALEHRDISQELYRFQIVNQEEEALRARSAVF